MSKKNKLEKLKVVSVGFVPHGAIKKDYYLFKDLSTENAPGLQTSGANLTDNKYQCECLDCGYIFNSDVHCKDTQCPLCGGECRRVDRPGIGQRSKEVGGDSEVMLTDEEIKKQIEESIKTEGIEETEKSAYTDFMSKCLKSGKSMKECAAEYKKTKKKEDVKKEEPKVEKKEEPSKEVNVNINIKTEEKKEDVKKEEKIEKKEEPKVEEEKKAKVEGYKYPSPSDFKAFSEVKNILNDIKKKIGEKAEDTVLNDLVDKAIAALDKAIGSVYPAPKKKEDVKNLLDKEKLDKILSTVVEETQKQIDELKKSIEEVKKQADEIAKTQIKKEDIEKELEEVKKMIPSRKGESSIDDIRKSEEYQKATPEERLKMVLRGI